jgi:hypothetical protein
MSWVGFNKSFWEENCIDLGVLHSFSNSYHRPNLGVDFTVKCNKNKNPEPTFWEGERNPLLFGQKPAFSSTLIFLTPYNIFCNSTYKHLYQSLNVQVIGLWSLVTLGLAS